MLSGDPEEIFLAMEPLRIRLAHQFDPMLAACVSQVDTLPHQIEAVYCHALQQPQLPFMIAHDAGGREDDHGGPHPPGNAVPGTRPSRAQSFGHVAARVRTAQLRT